MENQDEISKSEAEFWSERERLTDVKNIDMQSDQKEEKISRVLSNSQREGSYFFLVEKKRVL